VVDLLYDPHTRIDLDRIHPGVRWNGTDQRVVREAIVGDTGNAHATTHDHAAVSIADEINTRETDEMEGGPLDDYKYM
jgi:hypothetical protein